MYWYVIFVQGGREQEVVRLLKKRLDTHIFIPFVLVQEGLFKVAGKVKKELKILFPGYVFVESDLSSDEFIKRTRNVFYSTRHIISLLRYLDTEISLKESEKQILLNLCNDDYCIESSSGIIVGDRIHITDGPLKGFESMVRKINRHKRQACIEVDFMGDTRIIEISLEIIKKL